jgi:predicted MFS family arabinose efflux permease
MSRPMRVALAGTVALAVAMGIGRFAFTPILPMMQEQGGVSLAAGSWLASANYAGYLLGALWAARPARPHAAIRAALLAIAAATLAMALVHGFASWLVLRFVAGVASAWALVHVSSWCLAQLAAMPSLNGTLYAGVGIGMAIAGMACLALMHVGAGASQAWLALGALSFVLTAVVWPVLGIDGSAARPPAQGAPFRWTAEALRLVACYGVFGFGYIIPATFVPVMAKAVAADPRQFGWAWPIFGITAAASTLLAAPLLKATSNRALWRLSAGAMALGVAAPVLMPGAAGILLAALLVGGTFMVITMAGLQEARRVAGGRAPVLMAAMTAAFAAGQIAGPLSVPILVARAGFAAALVFASAVLVLSAVFLPKEKR